MIKKIIRAMVTAVALFLGVCLMVALFFGAVLQESYKLEPLTEQEVLNGND